MDTKVKQPTTEDNPGLAKHAPGMRNQRGRKFSNSFLAKRFVLGVTALTLCAVGYAQQVMRIGTFENVERPGKQYVDMVLPSAEFLAPESILYLQAKGGDGGKRYYGGWGPTTHYASGGEGATLAGWAPIGNEKGSIPPGSTIRFIIGEKGHSVNYSHKSGSGGGGGTGILFRAPDVEDHEWHHLIVAGGGGGAYGDSEFASFGGSGRNGAGGVAYPYRPAGEKGFVDDTDNISKMWAAGAGWKDSWVGVQYPYFNSARAGWPDYESNLFDSEPVGNKGAKGGSMGYGGWGYGGGGGGGDADPGCGGGASGGYKALSSGDAEKQQGGGYSWMNDEFIAHEYMREDGGNTKNPKNGYAAFGIFQSSYVEVAIRTWNGHYVRAKSGGGAGAVADVKAIGDHESFMLSKKGTGYNFRIGNHYLTAQDGGGSTLKANKSEAGDWETFTLEDVGGGFVAIKTSGGDYLRAGDGGGSSLNADRSSVGPDEKFMIVDLWQPPDNFYSAPDEEQLTEHDYLLTGQSIYTKNHVLSMQNDGNLVLHNTLRNYVTGGTIFAALWSSKTSGANCYAVFGGTLSVWERKAGESPSRLWVSGSGGTESVLKFQGDGNLVIYDASGTPKWSTGSTWGHKY